MGVYDRDYYRDEGGGWLGGLSQRVTAWLVGVTAVLWLVEVFSRPGQGGGDGGLFAALALTPDGLARGEVWRLLTASVIHHRDALFGVLLGLYTVYVFGSAVEDVLGGREYLALVVAAAVLGSLAQVALWAAAPGPAARSASGLGTVLVAVVIWYACQFPDARILLFFVLPVPAWVIGVGIAVLAALGGARLESGPAAVLVAAGFAFAHHRLRLRLTDWLPTGRRSGGRRLRVYENDDGPAPDAPTPPTPARPSRADEQLEAQIDRILEKMSVSGRASLSPEEQQVLLRASEVYRRRRGS